MRQGQNKKDAADDGRWRQRDAKGALLAALTQTALRKDDAQPTAPTYDGEHKENHSPADEGHPPFRWVEFRISQREYKADKTNNAGASGGDYARQDVYKCQGAPALREFGFTR